MKSVVMYLALMCILLLCIVIYDAMVIYDNEKEIQRLQGEVSECEFRTNVMFNAVMGNMDSLIVERKGHRAIK